MISPPLPGGSYGIFAANLKWGESFSVVMARHKAERDECWEPVVD
jgi:hypothetical protein